MIHTVKGFGLVNKAEIDAFLELSCFFHDPAYVGNLISGSPNYVTADVLSSYKLENSALTVSSVTPNEWQTNTGVAECGIGGVY